MNGGAADLSNVATFDDAYVLDQMVVWRNPATATLTVSFFIERDHGIGLFKQIDWETPVPEGAPLFIASSGTGVETLQMSWVGWREASRLRVVSLYVEEPADLPVNAAWQLFATPVVAPDRRLHLYFFGAAAGGVVLARYIVSGEANAPLIHRAEAVARVEGEPRLGVLQPVAGDAGTTAFAWVESVLGETVLTATLHSAAGIERMRSGFPKDLHPIARQQPGLHLAWNVLPPELTIAPSRRRVTFALLTKRGDSDECLLLETEFDFDAKISASVVHELPLAATDVEDATIAYGRALARIMPVVAVVTNGSPRVWMDAVPPLRPTTGPGLPVLMRGQQAIYELTFLEGVPVPLALR